MIVIRELCARDLQEIAALEKVSWPEDVQATEAQLQDRLCTFPDGIIGAYLSGRLVGMASSQMIRFSRKDPLRSWSELTADGWIRETHIPDGNCLHFVSICVHPGLRNRKIASKLNKKRLELAMKMGMTCALTDTRIPGLAQYLHKQPGRRTANYIEDIIAGCISEPVVRMYLSLQFDVLGVIPGSMKHDMESVNYGLAMIKEF